VQSPRTTTWPERPYPGSVSAYQANERQGRQGKITLVVGVAVVLVGFVLQAINVHSIATQGQPMFLANPGRTALLGQIAGFVILGGVVVTIVGIIRYAQSGSVGSSMTASAPMDRTGAGGFCSSCGDRLAGKGRYCASCGSPTAR
jgi:hypothetical protein